MVCSSDTVLGRRVSTPARSHDQHGHFQVVAHRVDGGSEDQVLQTAVAVRAHDNQIGPDFLARSARSLSSARKSA